MKRRLFLLPLLTALSLTGCDALYSSTNIDGPETSQKEDDEKEKTEATLQSISIFGSLLKKDYVEGEQWDTEGLHVKGIYSDGKDKTLDSSNYKFDFDNKEPEVGISNLVIWAYTIDKNLISDPVSYKVSVTKKEDKLESITLRGDLTDYEYYVDEEWDSTGLWVEGTYKSGKKEKLDSDLYEFVFDPAQPEEDLDEVSIYAKLKEGELKTQPGRFNVSVYEHASPEKTIQSIEITNSPEKTDYFEGDKWDLYGIQIKAYYNDESFGFIPTDECDFILDPEVPTVGDTSLSVIAVLKENKDIKSEQAVFTVSVSEIIIEPVGIEIRGDLENKEYDEGDYWDPTGLDVYILYSDNSDEKLDDSEYELSYNPEKAIKNTTSVIVTAYDEEHGFESDPFPIDVTVIPHEKQLEQLEIRGQDLTQKEYDENDNWNHNGLSVYGIYDDESERQLNDSEFIYIDSPSIAEKGTTSVNIRAKLLNSSLESASRDFAVTVNSTSTEDYTVTFNANGGSGTMANQTTSGSQFVVPECSFTKEGYSFANWALNSKTGVSYTPGEIIKNISNDLTLYAIWEQDSSGGEDTYYSECANLSGSALQAKLLSINKPKSPSYDWSRYEDADEALDDSNSIFCVYTRHNIGKSNHCGSYSWTTWNREHVWTQSAYPASKTDNHNIFACEGLINNYRGNLPYNEGGTIVSVHSHTTECKMVSGTSFEPCDAAKGEIARSVMYGTVMYSYTMTNEINSIYLALKWHIEHPITERDIKRNEIVYGNQGNRNPFVDHPEYACKIWGNTNSQTKQICGL